MILVSVGYVETVTIQYLIVAHVVVNVEIASTQLPEYSSAVLPVAVHVKFATKFGTMKMFVVQCVAANVVSLINPQLSLGLMLSVLHVNTALPAASVV